MATSDKGSSWERIQNGVGEAERLITQRDYNSSMVKSRQTLEFMVRQLALRARLDENEDLKSTIDALYRNRWISKTTFEHYHAIRMIGNKAVHEDYNNALDANQAYHMLSQEVYTFSNDYSNALKGSRGKKNSGGSSAARSRRRYGSEKKRGADPVFFVKILIPVLCVILLITVIRLFMPHTEGGETQPQTSAAEQASASETAQESETAPSPVIYKTTARLNVRSAPTTDSMILGQLSEGESVEYIGTYDSDWIQIRYNDSDNAYVSSQYLTTE